jgi:hypothetical protein
VRHKGVAWNKRLMRLGSVRLQRREETYVGLLNDEDEAAHARDIVALELWGDKAHLNFPKEV